MRIGLISQEYPPETAAGGIGTQTYLKAHGLAALGHEVIVISRSPDERRSERSDNGVTVIRTAPAAVPVYTEIADWVLNSARVAEEIARQHRLAPFDILDFPEWACEAYVHLLNQTEWNRIPTVIHLHGPLVMFAHTLAWPELDSEFFRLGSQMEAASLRLADAVFSSSACSADWCAREYGLDRESMPIIHTGIDTSLFYPRPVPKSAQPTIIFVGRLVRNKGVEVLLDAACAIASDFPGLQLRLLGGGERLVIESLQKKAAEKGLTRMLDMPGYIPRQDLPDQLSRAHVFAAPSQYEGGPGFVCLEAMACGLPVIACHGSGVAEVIRDGDTGLLVLPGDVAALTSALRRLLNDRVEREAMGLRASAFIREQMDNKQCIARIARFYQEVLIDVARSVREQKG